MAKWNMIKKKVASNGKIISTGQTTTPLFSNEDTGLKDKVANLENKLDTILTLLNKKEKLK